MKRLAVIALAAAGALAAGSAAAVASGPALLSVGQRDGRVSARWTLPPGLEAQDVVVSTGNVPDPTFGFKPDVARSRLYDWGVDGAQTSFTSSVQLEPGTYYVRVGAVDAQGSMRWSNILRLFVPRSKANSGAPLGFVGTTSQGQEIRLDVSPDRGRIQQIRFTARVRCGGSSSLRQYTLSGPLPTISGSFEGFFGGGDLSGAFHGPALATGKLRVNYTDLQKRRCDTGPVTWRAQRR